MPSFVHFAAVVPAPSSFFFDPWSLSFLSLDLEWKRDRRINNDAVAKLSRCVGKKRKQSGEAPTKIALFKTIQIILPEKGKFLYIYFLQYLIYMYFYL